ncbi:MAG: MFS transporter [Planctomycetota bacterium]
MFGVLRRNPEFLRLWKAQVVSRAGDWLHQIAVLVLIGRLGGKGSEQALGALFGVELALRLIPVAVFGPVAGPIADRFPRRFLMVAADLVRALIVLGFLLVREPGDLPLLYGLLFTQMTVGIFFESARSASVPNTVQAGDLHDALALSAATWSTMLAIGALAGGLLVHGIGVEGVFVADALTYVASALLLARLKLPAVPRHAEPLGLRNLLLLTDLRRGWSHVRQQGITPILAVKTCWGAAGGFLVILSIAGRVGFTASGSFPEGAAAAAGSAGLATGILYASRGLGTGIGPLLGRRISGSTEKALFHQILVGFLLGFLGYTLFGFTAALPLAACCVVLAHIGGSSLWVASTTFWQNRVEDAYRGRVFTLEFLGMTLAFSCGGLLAGFLYDRTNSLRATVWITSGLVLFLGAGWGILARPLYRRIVRKDETRG